MRNRNLLPFLGVLLLTLYGCQEAPPKPLETPKPSSVVELSDTDFIEKTRQGVVLLDAYADWCEPCRWMEPHLEEAAEALQGKVTVARIDVEANREFARYYKVEALPTLFVFVDGKVLESSPGARPAEGLLELVEKYLDTTEPESVVPASSEIL